MTTNLDTAHSQELYRRAGELIPGWTQLISRQRRPICEWRQPGLCATGQRLAFYRC
ncbi:MAG: hypothetical protein R2932_30180 [Caldilineaceae bacterium]